MTDPATRRVMDAMAAAGIGARFVGGCVRNALIGRGVDDIDIAVDRAPDLVMPALAAAGLKVVPTGLKHGTVTAVSNHKPYEITTLRRDVETDGRHAVVAFTDDWRVDAERRDFTMNAMSADLDGRLWDYFDGRADLAAGRVRFVGDADTRLDEDVLRLLRFFRFHAWYGQPPFDAEGMAACRRAVGRLAALSAERVRNELLKLLAAPEPADTVTAMATIGALDRWLPEFTDAGALRHLRALGPERDGLVGLATILPAGADATTIGKRLKLSTQQALRLETMLTAAAPLDVGDPTAVRRDVYRLGNALYRDRLLVEAARAGTRPGDRVLAGALSIAATWKAPEPPVRGSDALAAGIKAGPVVGTLVAGVEAWWIDRDFAPDRAACLAELRRRVAALPS